MNDDYSLIPKDSVLRYPLVWLLIVICCVLVATIFFTVQLWILDNQFVKSQTTLVNSLSCADLGSYIVKNSMNDSYIMQEGYMSDVYNLAKSKYLVCTHTPSSEMSP